MKKAYEIGCYEKIKEAKEQIKENNPDCLTSLIASEAYAKKAGIETPEEIKKLKTDSYKIVIASKLKDAEELIEKDPSEAIVALQLVEKYSKLSNSETPYEVPELRRKALINGIKNKTDAAKEALTQKDYETAIGLLNVAEKYAKESFGMDIPKEISELRKKAYEIGVKTKTEDVKNAINERDYVSAVGGCNLIEIFAKKAEIEAPKELSDLKIKAYKLAVEEKQREAKEALDKKDYAAVFGACSGMEIYSKKAGIDVPKEKPELMKKAYEIGCYEKIRETKELIQENNPDCMTSLKVSEAYARKAGIEIPEEISSLKKEVYKLVSNAKFAEAKELIESDPSEAVVLFKLVEKYSKLADTETPVELPELRKKALINGIQNKINAAKDAINQKDYESALGLLNVAEKYAKESGTDIPEEISKLRKDAYRIGVETKIKNVKDALLERDYVSAVGGCNLIAIFSKKAGNDVPVELQELRTKAYALGVEEKLREAREGIEKEDYGAVFGACAGIEIYAKKAGIDIPKETYEMRSEAYKIGCYSKIKEAKDFIEHNDISAIASLSVAESYAIKGGVVINIEDLKKEAYTIGVNSKISEIKNALNTKNFSDAVAALNVLSYYLGESKSVVDMVEIDKLRKDVWKLGAETKMNDAKGFLSAGNYLDAISSVSVAESCSERTIMSAEEMSDLMAIKKEVYTLGIRKKHGEILEFLAKNNYEEALNALKTIEVYAKKINVNIPEEINKIAPQVYEAGITGKINEAKDSLSRDEFSEAFIALQNAEKYAAILNKQIPEIEELKNKCFEIAVNAKISEAKDEISVGNYEDALSAIEAASSYSLKIGKDIEKELYGLKEEACRLGINAQIEEHTRMH